MEHNVLQWDLDLVMQSYITHHGHVGVEFLMSVTLKESAFELAHWHVESSLLQQAGRHRINILSAT